jgi:hypothetical protein
MHSINTGKPTLFHTCLFFLLLILISAPLFAADINVSFDRNPVSLDESFQIIFTAAESPDDDPDFSPLEQDFSILGQSKSSSSSWVNGKSSKTIQWTLNVMAKHAGRLVIPPVAFGKDVSPSSTILVDQNSSHEVVKNGEDLYIEVEAMPENPYIQSQVIYTLRLFTKVDIAQARLSEPELADAVIERLGEDRNYNTQVNGVNYSVTERKYAIFPQKSGKSTIKPLVLTAEVVPGNSSGYGGFSSFFDPQISKTKRVESKAITLDIKPAPASFAGLHWLPAEQLILKQEWSGDIRHMKIGEPLTRTLTVLAKGSTVGQLPELNASKTSAQLKAYPDQPVLQEQKKNDGLLALREEKIAVIPSAAGTYTLPAIEIPWFNTQSRKVEIAKISETAITVVAAEIQTAATAPAVTAVPPPKIEPSTPIIQPQQNNRWLWVSIFLASGWLMTLIFFITKRAIKRPVIEVNDADIKLEESIRRLKKACAENNAVAAKDALLEWGKQKYMVANLGTLAVFCDARLRDEILHLNQILYGRKAEQWQGKKLFQAFTENKAREKIASSKVDSSLEPLFRL